MFYIYQGDLCVTAVGQTIPQYKDLREFIIHKCGNDNLFIDICKYIFFVYHKVDALGNKNVFSAYPLKERREVVIKSYNLFHKLKHPSENSYFGAHHVYIFDGSKALLDFYNSITLTESERTREVFRQKINHWREKYSQVENSVEDDKDFAEALAIAEKNYLDYEKKILVESANEDEIIDGCPLYLFEIPENQKPMHIRLQYGDLKK